MPISAHLLCLENLIQGRRAFQDFFVPQNQGNFFFFKDQVFNNQMCRNSNSFGMEAQHLGASLVSFCCVTMFMSIPALPPSTASWKWSPPCRFVEDPIRQCYKKHEYMVWHVEDVKNTMVIPRQEPEESGVGREARGELMEL